VKSAVTEAVAAFPIYVAHGGDPRRAVDLMVS